LTLLSAFVLHFWILIAGGAAATPPSQAPCRGCRQELKKIRRRFVSSFLGLFGAFFVRVGFSLFVDWKSEATKTCLDGPRTSGKFLS
jgi:hypothetical protein